MITRLLTRHPVASYLALVFAISWSGVLLAVGGPSAIPGRPEDFAPRLPFAVLGMLAGPAIAGLLMTGITRGSDGYRDLLDRLTHRPTAPHWYLVALLSGPLVLGGTLAALSWVSPVYLPGVVTTHERAALLATGIGYGLAAGLFEEVGWTGFAIPRLLSRHGGLATGSVLGVVWGLWHLPSSAWGSAATLGGLPLPAWLAVALFSFLPPFRVLMVWVYQRTDSLSVAMLMHASLTASSIILSPAPIMGVPFLIYHLSWAAVLWTIVAAVQLAGHRPRRAHAAGIR